MYICYNPDTPYRIGLRDVGVAVREYLHEYHSEVHASMHSWAGHTIQLTPDCESFPYAEALDDDDIFLFLKTLRRIISSLPVPIPEPREEIHFSRASVVRKQSNARPGRIQAESDGLRFSIACPMMSCTEEKEEEAPVPSPLVVNQNAFYSLNLPDLDTTLDMPTQARAVYILFLRHPEGIRVKEIGDYRNELRNIYLTISTHTNMENLERTVIGLTDAEHDDMLRIAMSRAQRAVRTGIPKPIQHYYLFDGTRGQHRTIPLAVDFPDMISMPDNLRSSLAK